MNPYIVIGSEAAVTAYTNSKSITSQVAIPQYRSFIHPFTRTIPPLRQIHTYSSTVKDAGQTRRPVRTRACPKGQARSHGLRAGARSPPPPGL